MLASSGRLQIGNSRPSSNACLKILKVFSLLKEYFLFLCSSRIIEKRLFWLPRAPGGTGRLSTFLSLPSEESVSSSLTAYTVLVSFFLGKSLLCRDDDTVGSSNFAYPIRDMVSM